MQVSILPPLIEAILYIIKKIIDSIDISQYE